MTTTMTRPATATELHRQQREEATRLRLARRRVEDMHLPYCRICSLAQPGSTDDADLLCVCEKRQAEVNARVEAILERHRDRRRRPLRSVQ